MSDQDPPRGDGTPDRHRSLASKSKPAPVPVEGPSAPPVAPVHHELPPDEEPRPSATSPCGRPTASPVHPAASSMSEALLQRVSSAPRQAFYRVLDCGVTAEQGSRRTMEDQHVMTPDGIPFFAVYDGHAGTRCAEYLRDNLHHLILNHPHLKDDPERAVFESVVEADRAFLYDSDQETNESGSVCAIALIIDDKLVVGNVGDCEAVLCHDGVPRVLTVKHTLGSNPEECERVRAAGGRVFHNRVGHPKFNPGVVSLAVTRAIGDAGFKLDEYTDGRPSGVIAEPHTSTTKLDEKDEFLVIGCDGLWDVMTYDEVIDFCDQRFRLHRPSQQIAEELAQAALNKGSTDNVTAMLVRFNRSATSTTSSAREFIPEAAVSSVRNAFDEL